MLILKFICLSMFILSTVMNVEHKIDGRCMPAKNIAWQAVSAAGFITFQWLM